MSAHPPPSEWDISFFFPNARVYIQQVSSSAYTLIMTLPEVWAFFVGPFITSKRREMWAFLGGGGEILSHWDRLLLEVQKMRQWRADWLQAHERLKQVWEIIHYKGFRDVCKIYLVQLQQTDNSDRVWCQFSKSNQCNICFDCLIYYDSRMSLTDNRCTWYKAHFRNGLRNSILDEDLSQAQPSAAGGWRFVNLRISSHKYKDRKLLTNTDGISPSTTPTPAPCGFTTIAHPSEVVKGTGFECDVTISQTFIGGRLGMGGEGVLDPYFQHRIC